MAIVEESVFPVAVGIVTPVLEGVDVKVASTSVAVVVVATALEVVDVKVAVLDVVVVKVASPLDRWKLKKGGLHRHIRSVGLPVVECN